MAQAFRDKGAVNEVQGPIRSAEKEETVKLIPMGAARLRISAFPRICEGPDAKEWAKVPFKRAKLDRPGPATQP